MTFKRASLFLLTMMLAAACTGRDRAQRDRGDTGLSSGPATFREASEMIAIPKWGGEKAFGNTPEAKKLAARFAELLETMQEIVFEKGFLGSVPVKNEVRVYCVLSVDTALFLVYVPELRKYTNSAQETLVGVGWMIAKQIVKPIRKDLDKVTLGVGFRGVLFYGAAGMGPASGEKPSRTYVKGPVHEDVFSGFFGRPTASLARRETEANIKPEAPGPLPAIESTPKPPPIVDNMPPLPQIAEPTPPAAAPTTIDPKWRTRVTDTRPAHASIALVRGGHTGAAFAVGKDFLVTAIDSTLTGFPPVPRATLELELPNGRVVEGQVVDQNRDTGLALVRVTPGLLPGLPLAKASDISTGTPVVLWAAAARHGELAPIAESRIRDVRHDTTWMEVEAFITPTRKAVGGPLLDPRGRVVGVAIWFNTDPSPRIVSVQHVTELIARHSANAGSP